MVVRKTQRGFNVYEEFQDTYYNQVRIQESSGAEEPRVWIFLERSNSYMKASVEAHLNEAMVDKVIAALQEWKQEHGIPVVHLKPTD